MTDRDGSNRRKRWEGMLMVDGTLDDPRVMSFITFGIQYKKLKNKSFIHWDLGLLIVGIYRNLTHFKH